MLDELTPMNLVSAAAKLGVSPFEVIRLLVASDGVPANMQFTTEQVARLREVGQIEDTWWPGVDLPDDANPLRQRVRAALQLLIDRGHVADSMTRMDNVWRGLTEDDCGLVNDALLALVDEGHLNQVSRPNGTMISVNPASSDTIQQLASGAADTPGLSELYEE